MEQNDDIDLFSFERARDELFEPEYEPIYNKDGVEVEKGRKDPYGVIYSLNGKRLIKSTDRYIEQYTIREGVEKICNEAFYLSEIEDITLPKSVISIGDFAFWCCYNLRNIGFPKDVVSIGDFAFYHCGWLKNIIFPEKVSKIGDGAFGKIPGSIVVTSLNPVPPDCDPSTFMNADLSKSLLIVAFGSREAYLKARVWRRFRYVVEWMTYCNMLFNDISKAIHSSDEPEWYIIEGNRAVDNVLYDRHGRLLKFKNDGTDSYTIISGTEVICERAFFLKNKVKEILIPDSVKIIGTSAFYSCGVEKVTFGSGVETIGEHAFADSSVVGVTIPRSVKYIGDFAFSDCKCLTDVYIEGEIDIVGYAVFEGCASLKHVLIPKSVTIIEERAWNGCKGLETFVSLNPIPPACEKGAFEKVPVETCVVYVPKGAKGLYSKVDGWRDFENIVEIDESLVFQKLR